MEMTYTGSEIMTGQGDLCGGVELKKTDKEVFNGSHERRQENPLHVFLL